MALTGTILVVEDERSMREFLEILLNRHNHDVTTVENGEIARDLLGKTEFDLVITDLKLPGMSGLDVLSFTKEQHPHTEVIIVTAFASTDTAITAMKQGAYDYLIKPFKVDELLVTVERTLEKRALVRDIITLREELHGRYRLDRMVGRSPVMQQLFSTIRKVAETRTSILILGESGTGKELVAQAIHSLSDRRDRPFIPVNCGAIPEQLIESELFGHVRGAFTGADSRKEGLFMAADGGTLFLDEIGELSSAMQVKLLRTLQERRIKPVGAVTEQAVDLRLITASNKDLEDEVAAGRFRSDLFYRLNVIPLRVPALREREEDIPLLVDHFLRKYTAQIGRTIRRIAPEAMSLLRSYRYPGNVRELENLIERAVTLTSTDEIDASALPELRRVPPPSGESHVVLPMEGIDLDAHMAGIEQNLLLNALARTDGNRADTAKLLKINMRSLRYRLAKYGINGSE